MNRGANLDGRYDRLPMFDRPEHKPVARERRFSLEHAFRKYHAALPAILDAFVGLARAYQSHGQKVGAKAIAEELRWHRLPGVVGPSGFKMPNAHVAFYARLAMHRAPDLAGFFDLATQRGPEPFRPETVTP